MLQNKIQKIFCDVTYNLKDNRAICLKKPCQLADQAKL